MRILVVEDERKVASFIKHGLRKKDILLRLCRMESVVSKWL